LTGAKIYEKINNIEQTFTKFKKKVIYDKHNEEKTNLFDIPYWLKLEVKHCIDIMHGEECV